MKTLISMTPRTILKKLYTNLINTPFYLKIYFRYRWEPTFGSIQDYLKRYSQKHRNIGFMQIGANDGWTDDPYNKFIISYNWHGVLVEPVPEVYLHLKENYKKYKAKLQFENCAIGNQIGKRDFYKGVIDEQHPESITRLSSFDKTKVEDLRTEYPNVKIESIEVSVQTIKSICDKHRLGKIEILLIDAEGYDWEIIKTLDFNQLRPSLLVYEHSNLSENDKLLSWKQLQQHGYILVIEDRDTLAVYGGI